MRPGPRRPRASRSAHICGRIRRCWRASRRIVRRRRNAIRRRAASRPRPIARRPGTVRRRRRAVVVRHPVSRPARNLLLPNARRQAVTRRHRDAARPAAIRLPRRAAARTPGNRLSSVGRQNYVFLARARLVDGALASFLGRRWSRRGGLGGSAGPPTLSASGQAEYAFGALRGCCARLGIAPGSSIRPYSPQCVTSVCRSPTLM